MDVRRLVAARRAPRGPAACAAAAWPSGSREDHARAPVRPGPAVRGACARRRAVLRMPGLQLVRPGQSSRLPAGGAGNPRCGCVTGGAGGARTSRIPQQADPDRAGARPPGLSLDRYASRRSEGRARAACGGHEHGDRQCPAEEPRGARAEDALHPGFEPAATAASDDPEPVSGNRRFDGLARACARVAACQRGQGPGGGTRVRGRSATGGARQRTVAAPSSRRRSSTSCKSGRTISPAPRSGSRCGTFPAMRRRSAH